MKKILYYIPRVISGIIVAFFALFILEGFDPNFTWFDSLMHGLLALVALTFTIFTWKKPKIGGWIFVSFGVWYMFSVIRAGWYGGLFLGSIPIVTGMLFIIETKFSKHV